MDISYDHEGFCGTRSDLSSAIRAMAMATTAEGESGGDGDDEDDENGGHLVE